MIRRPSTSTRRSGAAAAEFAVVMAFVIVPLMTATWEYARLIHVHQIVASAAREGARLAAQSLTISTTGGQTKIYASLPPESNTTRLPNVKAAVFQSLYGAGLKQLKWDTTNDDVAVEFKYLDQPTVTKADGSTYTATEGPSTANPNPHTGVQGQKFTVKVTIPTASYKKLIYTPLTLIGPTAVSYTVEWRMMVDIPFYVNEALPKW